VRRVAVGPVHHCSLHSELLSPRRSGPEISPGRCGSGPAPLTGGASLLVLHRRSIYPWTATQGHFSYPGQESEHNEPRRTSNGTRRRRCYYTLPLLLSPRHSCLNVPPSHFHRPSDHISSGYSGLTFCSEPLPTVGQLIAGPRPEVISYTPAKELSIASDEEQFLGHVNSDVGILVSSLHGIVVCNNRLVHTMVARRLLDQRCYFHSGYASTQPATM
jgi:hypothetical protein